MENDRNEAGFIFSDPADACNACLPNHPMSRFANSLARILCLAVYAAAALRLTGYLAGGLGDYLPLLAGAMLAIHAVELVFVFKYLGRHRGPLAASVALTLLFGLFHWRPLVTRQ